MDEGRSKLQYNLRSSLKKSSKNPFGSLDVSDEGDDITLPPPPRRVSFAASSTVKPFVNDPEKNTIWDNTYEEEINHTDSNNVLSLDSHINIQEIQRVNIDFNQSFASLETNMKNSNESNINLPSQVKFTAGESMELTCLWKNNIIDNNKVFLNNMAENVFEKAANYTQIQDVDMSLTNCGLGIANKENIPSHIISASKEGGMSLTNCCRKIVDKENIPLSKTSASKEVDVCLTNCGLGIVDKENIPLSITSVSKEVGMCLTNCGLGTADKENIPLPTASALKQVDMRLINCGLGIADKENIPLPIVSNSNYNQGSQSKIRQKQVEAFADESLFTKTVKDPSDMGLTGKFNSEPGEPMEVDETIKTYKNCSIYQECDMSLTCKFNNVIINKDTIDTNKQNTSGMEFTCIFPPKNATGVTNCRSVSEDIISAQSSSDQKIADMKLARSFPQDNIGIQKTANFNQTETDMELTCQLPDKSTNLQKTEKNIDATFSNVNQTEANMEVTCQIYQRTQKMAELDSTCFPSKVVKKKSIFEAKHANVNQSSVDMEFTCKFSQNISQEINRNEIVPKHSEPIITELSNSKLSTSQNPHYVQEYAKNELLKTCQLETDMEFTGILPQKVIDLCSGTNKTTITEANPKLALSNVTNSTSDKKLACHSSQDNTNSSKCQNSLELNANSSDAETKLACDHPKTTLKSIDIYNDDSTYNAVTVTKSLGNKSVQDSIDNKENLGSQETIKTLQDVQGQTQQDNQSVNKENIYNIHELNKNRHNHSSFNMNFTCKTLLLENSSAEKYNEINSITQTSSAHRPKLQMEDTIMVSLPQLLLEPKDDTSKVQQGKPLNIMEFSNVPGPANCTDLSIDNNIKDNTLKFVVQNENLAIAITKANKNDTIAEEECSLVDTLASIVDEDLPDNILSQSNLVQQEECATQPKVIYSEPLKVVKPSLSMLDFSSAPSSGKKPFNFSSLNSMDGTQQLIEATFSKPAEKREAANDSSVQNESGLVLIDNTVDEHQSLRNSLDQNSPFSSSSVIVQKILDNIQHKIVKYERPQFDFNDYYRLLQENQHLLDNVKSYLETSNSPERQHSSLSEKIREISLANSSYNCSKMSDTMYEDADDDINNGCGAVNVPKSLNERILEIVSSVEEHIIKLEYNKEYYYIFSTFSQGAWFAVDLHPEDGRVTSVKTIVGLKEGSASLFASEHKFVVDCICKKLEMYNLKSSLGTCFDVLSLLHHVIMMTENSLEFCLEFLNANRQYKTLRLGPDGQVSYKILVTNPPILWTIQFKMASIENIDQNSLRCAASRGRTINEDHLKTILRNTEPGIDSIRRFVAGVKDYFERTHKMKLKALRCKQNGPKQFEEVPSVT